MGPQCSTQPEGAEDHAQAADYYIIQAKSQAALKQDSKSFLTIHLLLEGTKAQSQRKKQKKVHNGSENKKKYGVKEKRFLKFFDFIKF